MLGAGTVTSNMIECAPGGWVGTNTFVANGRPAGAPGNSPTTSHIALFFGAYAIAMQVPMGMPVNEWTAVPYTLSVGSRIFDNPTPAMQIRPLETPEGTAQDARNEIHLIGDIRNFDAIPGCIVRVNALFRLRM